MAVAKILRIYLDETPLARAADGKFNFINKIESAFRRQGFQVELKRNSDGERVKSAARRGYSLFMMDDPFHARALTMRKAYYYPFWRIESSAQRWKWDITKERFDPDAIDEQAARRFCRTWRKNLFGAVSPTPTQGGYVYVPLQGLLLDHRSFQTMSPVDMVRAVLTHDPDRKVIAGLHPGEIYLPEERQALDDMITANPRLSLSDAPMEDLLLSCDYVATQNSSVALTGFFIEKPAVLFAQIDFRHIASNVADLGAQDAIRAVPNLTPDYEKYLYWFLKLTTISGGAEDAEDQILNAVRAKGWLV